MSSASSPIRLRRILKRAYPVRMVVGPNHARAWIPDLPEVTVTAPDADTAYTRLEQAKRAHLAACVAHDRPVPRPNSHLLAAAEGHT